jgi:hypothetical protein
MLNVIVTGKIAEDGLKMLEEIALVTVIENPTSSELVKALPTADAILHKIGKLPAHLLEQAPKLRIIARHGVGLDDLDLDYIKSKGIKLTTTDNANSNAVAELTIGLIISLNRRIVEARKKLMTAGFWQREDLMGRELAGQKPLPFNGIYAISKTALECYADSLRLELMLLNIPVITVRPGAFNTQLLRASSEEMDKLKESTKLYKNRLGRIARIMTGQFGKAKDPKLLAKVFWRAATSAHPRMRYTVNASAALRLYSAMPRRLQAFALRLLLRGDRA